MNAMKMFVAAAGAVLLTVGLASATMAEEHELHSDEARNKLAAFEYTGKSRLCLPMHRIRDIDVLDDWTLLIEMAGRSYYVTHLAYQCPRLAVEDRFTYTLHSNLLCHADLITVITITGTALASCPLAEFEELREKEGGTDR